MLSATAVATYEALMSEPFDYAVSLQVRHPTATADHVAALVGLELQRGWTIGEARTTPTGGALAGLRDETYCAFRLGQGSDGELAECLRAAIKLLKTRKAELRQLRSDGGSLLLFASWQANGDTGEVFEQSLLSDIAALGIDLGMNVLGSPA